LHKDYSWVLTWFSFLTVIFFLKVKEKYRFHEKAFTNSSLVPCNYWYLINFLDFTKRHTSNKVETTEPFNKQNWHQAITIVIPIFMYSQNIKSVPLLVSKIFAKISLAVTHKMAFYGFTKRQIRYLKIMSYASLWIQRQCIHGNKKKSQIWPCNVSEIPFLITFRFQLNQGFFFLSTMKMDLTMT